MQILNIKTDPAFNTRDYVNIMRGGPLGNPYKIGQDGTRDEVVDLHKRYVYQRVSWDKEFRELVKGLVGKRLVCCCAPLRCHGDNLKLLCEELNK